ncbi:hypothetical protein FRC03_010046 [Tulasnella sp. 419]|nr:hypothetical protein FRC03_010046 [Tulasnella sp. 419]
MVTIWGHGFIGSHIAKYLYDEGHRVRIVDTQAKSLFETPIAQETIVGDLRLPSVCRQAVTGGVSTVLHFAAVMGGMGMIHEDNDMTIYHQNHLMTTNILSASRDAGVKCFMLASTACVYPSKLQSSLGSDIHLREADAYHNNSVSPQGLYGLEKLASEQLVRVVQRSTMEIRIVRFHNVYGPRGEWYSGREKAPAALLRKALVAEALKGQGPSTIELWGNGQQRRSFLYIDDCIDALIKLLRSDFQEPLNIGSDSSVSIQELANIACRVVGLKKEDVSFVYDTTKPLGVISRNSNNELVSKKLKWKPRVSLEEGMRWTGEWMRDEILNLSMERLQSLRESRVVDLRPDPIVFAILLPITSRVTPESGLCKEDCLIQLGKFADSLNRTTAYDTNSPTSYHRFSYRIYLAIDDDDEFLLPQSKELSRAVKMLHSKGVVDIEVLVLNEGRGNVCGLWRKCARRAWENNCTYYVLMGDDVELLDEGWMSRVHQEFTNISKNEGVPVGFGCVAFKDISFPGMPTFPVLHKTHLDIFEGEVIPPIFFNQDGDPYLFQLYRRWGCSRMLSDTRLRNAIGGSETARYKKRCAVDWTFDTLDRGIQRIEEWMKEKVPGLHRRLTIDVVVPTYRVQIPLLKTILSLKPSPTCSVMFIIIIDDPTSPHIFELEHTFGHDPYIRIRTNKTNSGASASRNRGMVEESSAEWLFFLDDDTVPEPNLLVETEKVIRQHPLAAGFVGNTQFPSADSVATAAAILSNVTFFWDIATKIPDDVPWGVTANLIIRRHVQDKDIVFDPGFPKTGGGEDIDICLRKKKASVERGGDGFFGAPDVVVTHPWWNNGGRSYKRFYMWAHGDGMLIRMWPQFTYSCRAPNCAESILITMGFAVLGLCWGLARNDWSIFLGSLKMAASVLLANFIHDLYLHLWRDVERTRSMKTTVSGIRWIAAILEGTLIRVSSEVGRTMGLIQRGDWKQLMSLKRFDWFVGRWGPATREEEQKNTVETAALSVLLFALWVVRESF